MTVAEADAYFSSRPQGSQIAAWASQQSCPVASRKELMEAVEKAETRFGDREVPRPPHWSGFRLMPDEIEFWSDGQYRLHDRVLLKRIDDSWQMTRLFP